MPMNLLILGITGDLTPRFLLPALVRMKQHGQLELDRIVGIGRKDWTTQRLKDHFTNALEQHAPETPHNARDAVVNLVDYRKADVANPDHLRDAIATTQGPVAIYLALPPTVFEPVLKALAQLELPQGSRIVIEKPFGHDLESAKKLNALIQPTFPEESVFRIDHFLGEYTWQNILGLRFANRIFEHLWNRNHIQKVEIYWDETVALEGRAGYYDQAGALRDMVQNHLLQLLCLVAMEAPHSLNERDFRDRKLDALRAVRRYSPEEVAKYTKRARYTAGKIGERSVPSYVEESGVDPSRNTETFTEVTLLLDNERWAGVPFVLRTGKALAEDRYGIRVHFHPVPHLPFEETAPEANVLHLRLEPDRMDLQMNIFSSNTSFALQPVHLNTRLAESPLTAYGRLLLDIFQGNPILSIRCDEAEESWRIVDPILAAWRDGVSPMQEYAAGSQGP
jgi:glucose-6-phosphate 1-dehydrogenase